MVCVCDAPVCTRVEAGTGHQVASFSALHLIALIQGLLTHPFGQLAWVISDFCPLGFLSLPPTAELQAFTVTRTAFAEVLQVSLWSSSSLSILPRPTYFRVPLPGARSGSI